MLRKTHHVVPNSDRAVGMSNEAARQKHQSILIPKRMLNSTDVRSVGIRDLNFLFTVKTAKSRDLTATAMIRILLKDNTKLTRFTSFSAMHIHSSAPAEPYMTNRINLVQAIDKKGRSLLLNVPFNKDIHLI